MDIDKAIRLFSEFLNSSWENVLPSLVNRTYTTNESSINDWLQANWELLVERKVLPLNEYLEIYGEGADFYGGSSRITDIGSTPHYSIKVISCSKDLVDLLNNTKVENDEFTFERLVGFEKGFYIDNPPFKYVLTQDDRFGLERVFFIDEVKFKLNK